MTFERYTGMVDAQGGCCAVCGEPTEKLTIDHDHSCCPGGVKRCGECNRDLLCKNCNTGLGHFMDDPGRLSAAIEYLRKWGK